ncbi:MAG TPA: DUF1802 family protein [Opitutaceae bacterium]|jgi:hypothetical protein|nr:DUF1802 family protein [Opitutaceae bacterium]
MSPAFKEWHVIVEALGAGEQVLILRKGGIAEGRGGFEVKAEKFWLFPTHFHEQLAKTKPAAQKFFTHSQPKNEPVNLRYFAEVVQQAFLSDWAAVARLDAFHLWTEETIRERFNWAQPPGLHAFAVRMHRLKQPALLEVTPEMNGCKSWVDVPLDFAAHASEPVLSDAAFNEKLAALKLK